MKKQIVTACALIASVAAFATSVESSNTFGVLKVSAAAAASSEVQLIIPVPWENVGTASGVIDPTAYVLAANRKRDDALFYYNPDQKAYKVWVMSEDSGAWEPVVSYSIADEKNLKTITADGTFARGKAVVLKLVNGSTGDIFLSGQYAGSPVVTEIVGPDSSAPTHWKTFTLIAPSVVGAINLNDESATYFYRDSGCQTAVTEKDIVGDQIVLDDGTTYYCEFANNKLSWYKLVEGTEPPRVMTHSTEGVTLPSGKGAWYVRAVHSAAGAAQTIYVKW